MENIEIRKATLNDLEVIRSLNHKLFVIEKNNYDNTLIDEWPLTEDGTKYFKDLITNHYVVVAILNGEIVGYLAGTINEQGAYENVQYGELNNMLITDKCRGKGVGSLLINAFKSYCKSNSINNLIVTASAKNFSAINFYKKNGFEDFNLTLTMKIEEE